MLYIWHTPSRSFHSIYCVHQHVYIPLPATFVVCLLVEIDDERFIDYEVCCLCSMCASFCWAPIRAANGFKTALNYFLSMEQKSKPAALQRSLWVGSRLTCWLLMCDARFCTLVCCIFCSEKIITSAQRISGRKCLRTKSIFHMESPV